MDYKINDNLKTEKLKNFELEKLAFSSKQDNQISIIRKDYEAKITKLKEDNSKLEYENKIKDEQLLTNNNSNDKMSSLTNQKVKIILTIRWNSLKMSF
jgi:hypothetical protein